MRKTLLFFGGLSLLGFGLYRYFKVQTKKLLDYDWKFSSIKINRLKLTELNATISILFTSKSDIEAKVNRLYLDIYINNKKLGYIIEDKVFVIPANGSANIPLTFSVNPQAIFKNLIDLSLGVAKDRDAMLKLDGFANIRSGFVSTTLPIKYETSIREYLKGV
jgi:hypothetical protein